MMATFLGIFIAFLGIFITVAIGVGTYVTRRSVWEVKMEMMIKAIVHRLTLIEKHIGIAIGGNDDSSDDSSS